MYYHTLSYSIILCIVLVGSIDCLVPFKQSECGRTKSCFRWSTCDFPKCDFGFSWREIQFNNSKYLEVEIVGRMQSELDGFIALGFSLSPNMMDNGIVACRMDNGLLNISAGFNEKPINVLFNSSEIDSDFLITSNNTLYGVEFDHSSRALRCRFLRLVSPTMNMQRLKNLNNGEKYYLTSAKGGNNSPKQLSYHSNNKRVTLNPYLMTSSDRVNGILSSSYRLVKIHACCMIFGWILFVTNGIYVAFFYKKNWPNKLVFGQKIWFQLHRLLQTGCIVCVVTGFIVIFVHVGGYSFLDSLPNSAHPILGILATSLLLINPIIALFRCKPEEESRWIFNWIHFGVGITAYACGLTNIIIGIHMPPSGPQLFERTAPFAIAITFFVVVGLHFCTYAFIKISKNILPGSTELSLNDSKILHDSQAENLVDSESTTVVATNRIILEITAVTTIFTAILVVFVLIY